MYIGIDLGGTNYKCCIMNSDGNLIHKYYSSTNAHLGLQHVIDMMCESIKKMLKKCPDIQSIGLGIPGVTTEDGLVRIAPNLPGWIDVPIAEILRKRFSLPVKIDNDANIAAYAEMMLGSAVYMQDFIYVTLGTGVGGAIVYNREIFRGTNGGAGEIGHIIINSLCELNKEQPFRTGILEEYIGKNQITEQARLMLDKNSRSILKNHEKPDPYFVSQCAHLGDQLSIEILRAVGNYLGIALASAMNILDISTVIVGGGLSQSHDSLYESALQTIKMRALPPVADRAEVIKAYFTKDAGLIGAALLGKSIVSPS